MVGSRVSTGVGTRLCLHARAAGKRQMLKPGGGRRDEKTCIAANGCTTIILQLDSSESAQNQFFGCWNAYAPPPIPLHRAALLEGACSLTSPMRHLSCRHTVAASSASLSSICTWTRSRHDEETLSIAMQSAPKSTAEVLSDCRSRGHL